MKIISFALILLIISSCSSSRPTDTDPNQQAYYKVVKLIREHKYQEAKDSLKNFSSSDGEVDYYVVDQYDGHQYSKVTFKVSDMTLYLDDLISAKKQLDEGCVVENEHVQNTATKLYENYKNMGQLYTTMDILKLQVAEECFNKSERHDFTKLLHQNIHKTLAAHPWEYFKHKKNFIFGDFVITLCGDDHRSVARAPKDVFRCYKSEMGKTAKTKYEAATEKYRLTQQETAELQKKQERDQLEKEDLDGTSLLKSYCWSLQVINKTNQEVQRENMIGKETGYIDQNKMYNYGQHLVDFKARAKNQETAYRKLTGKILKSSMCKAN